MTTIDIVICVLILLGAIVGYAKGFLKLLATLLGLVVGLVAAWLMYAPLAERLCPTMFQSPTVAQAIAFVLIWVAVPVAAAMVASLFTRALGNSLLGMFNRWMGALIGAAELFIVVALVITTIEYIDVHNEWIGRRQKRESVLYYPIADLAAHYIPRTKQSMRDFIEDGLDDIQRLRVKSEK